MNILRRVVRRALRPGAGRLLILVYDAVGDESGEREEGEFVWQMEQVAAHFEPIVLSRLMGHLGGKKPLEGPQVCVCFRTDRGAQFAMTVTRRLGIPATWFIPFDQISDGNRSGATAPVWNGATIGELLASGSEIGHRIEGDPSGDSPHRRTCLSTLRCRAEQHTGVRVHAIAFPTCSSRGRQSLIYDAAIAGFNLGIEPAAGVNSLRSLAPMMLKSEAITPKLARAQFRALLNALEPG